jgi:hypothetical protein
MMKSFVLFTKYYYGDEMMHKKLISYVWSIAGMGKLQMLMKF